jgi:TolB-like protein/DNA-binding winged helix-turn-helix (wHTH) protein/Tfp pilus assembly protein PilF
MSGAPSRPQRQVRLPQHIVDLAVDELRTTEGTYVELRPRSFAVLRLLAEHAGRLVGKDDIIAKVWDDVAVTEDSLTQCIADIRKTIGDDDRRVLRTVPRKGYLLVPAQWGAQLAGRVPDRPSLAVMPFMSIGGEEALGIGIASEIINELARNKDLRLLARDSSFALANQDLTAQEIGEHLRARYLVEGTIQRSDDTLMVDVQLVDALEGTIAWGDRFSAGAEHVPQVNREIASKIAASLHSGMREVEKHAILGVGPRDLDVYQLTLRGLARKHQFSPEATRAGRADLEQAVRRDPNYAPAWAYLAWTNLLDMVLQFTGEWHFSQLGEVIGQFKRAIELDPSLPAPYQGLSQALIYADDVTQSLAVARRAVELGPSDADGLIFLANALFESGEPAEAMEAAKRAMEHNPLPPPFYHLYAAMVLWGNERYQEALHETEECLRKAPNFGGADTYRAMALVGLGRLDEAKAQLKQCMARPGGIVIVTPHPPELARRTLADLQAAGWRPSLATDREVG